MGSYSWLYGRIWTPRAGPRATKAAASGWHGPPTTLTSWTEPPQERRNEGKPFDCKLGPPGRGVRGRDHGHHGLRLDVVNRSNHQAAADCRHEAADVGGGHRRGGVEPHRLGRLRADALAEAV